MIEYTINVNENKSITLIINTIGVMQDYSDDFLRLLTLQNGFSGNLGFGELLLMLSPYCSGELTSPIYEVESDRQLLIDKINQSLGAVNG